MKMRTDGNGDILLLFRSYRIAKWFCRTNFSRKFPKLAKQIKAADGKCVDIEISMKVVEKC